MKARKNLFFVAVLGLLALCGPAWAIEDSNLVSCWKFDEGEGSIAYDSAGSNHGTLMNGATWTTGQIDGALSFDGVDDYVHINDAPDLDGMDAITLTAWIKTGATGQITSVINKAVHFAFFLELFTKP